MISTDKFPFNTPGVAHWNAVLGSYTHRYQVAPVTHNFLVYSGTDYITRQQPLGTITRSIGARHGKVDLD